MSMFSPSTFADTEPFRPAAVTKPSKNVVATALTVVGSTGGRSALGVRSRGASFRSDRSARGEREPRSVRGPRSLRSARSGRC